MSKGKIGVLLANLGTPDDPSRGAVYRYLKQFLTDGRVIDIPWIPRQLLVRGIIAPFRSGSSAKLYKMLWTEEGSPIKVYGYKLKEEVQGNWGELILESVLDKSGLEKDREYFLQQTFDHEGKQVRPDVIIHLPDGKRLIIDSKVSLTAYEQMIRAEDQAIKTFEKAHLLSVRKHIDGLSAKNYHDVYQIESPDFVLLFIPIDTAFASAIKADPGLYQYAFDKNIVIVTPSTLLATLKTVDSLWKNEKQQKHALDIATEAGKMYDKFVGLVEDLDKLGKQMDTARGTYHDSMKKLKEGSGNLVGRAEKIKALGAKANKKLS